MSPLLRYSYHREAFVLRGVGRSMGPVLREERRGRRDPLFEGIERRRGSAAARGGRARIV